MRKGTLKYISNDLSEISQSSTKLMKYFIKTNETGDVLFDPNKEINGADISFSDCLSQLTAIAGIAESFGNSDRLLLVPLPRISKLKQEVDETKIQIDTLSNSFHQLTDNGGTIRYFNYENFHFYTADGHSHDFRALFKNFSDRTEELLDAFFNVLLILQPTEGSYNFQEAADALSALVKRSTEELKSLRVEHTAWKEASADASTATSEAKAEAEEATRHKDEAAKDRKTISEYLSEVTEKRASIDSIHSSASSLENAVTNYQGTFDAFDNQLAIRNKSFEEGEAKKEKLFTDFDKNKKYIEELITKSESMLRGATVAGLASSFSDARKELDNQLNQTLRSFKFGIFLLFISATPLILLIFLPVIEKILLVFFPEISGISSVASTTSEITGWQYLGQVLARFVILLPAAWFVSFSAIRYSSLFRLREHYAYKYSMAVSAEGFRKQAEGYENEIAALVLEQIAFNPADKLIPSKEIKEGKVPQPMLDLFLEKFRSSLNKEKNKPRYPPPPGSAAEPDDARAEAGWEQATCGRADTPGQQAILRCGWPVRPGAYQVIRRQGRPGAARCGRTRPLPA